ncbi:MAG: DUF262 domain-containing protein [Candidatus Bathyarchaeia archaeon]
MDVHDEKFGNLIYTRRQYIIPIWQREYSWYSPQWKDLWEDLLTLYEQRFKKEKSQEISHFMGSLVLKPRELGGVEKYVLIDGQQRISTLIVILVLLRNWAKERNPSVSNAIQDSYLLNRDIKKPDERFKLCPSVSDSPDFEKMMNGDTDLSGRFGDAYNFFFERLQDEEKKGTNGCEVEKLKEIIIDNLKFVEIILSEKDDSNRIFETLNSRGLELEPADLLRNFFMMKIAKESDAESQYTSAWLPMQQKLVTAGNLTEYFRHYLAMGSQAPVKREEIYSTIDKKFKWSTESEIVDELRKLKDYSKYYQRLLFPTNEPNDELRARLEELNIWRVTTAYPLLLRAYTEKLSEEELGRLVDIILSFVVRRYFCNVKTNSLNAIFTSLCDLDKSDPVRSIENKLKGFRWNYRWPDDEEFFKAFIDFPIYHGNYAKCFLVLASLELSFGHPETVDFSNLTVEHVMPETITDWWKQHLGADWQRVHSGLKDTVGNLTFVAGPINPSLSNDPFPIKKKWFMKTKVELSTSFQFLENWQEADIRKRGEELAERAVQMWKRPASK